MRSLPRLRVCMVVTYDLASRGGGVKAHAVNLSAALRKIGDEVVILGPSSSRRLNEPWTFGLRGVINVPSNGSDNYLGILVCPYQVRRFFRQHHFDVIHVHEPLNPALSYWTTWLTTHIPHIATFHAFAEEEPPAKLAARRIFSTTLQPWFQRSIAVSEPAARYASAAWKGPLALIPNGVPTAQFRPAPPTESKGPVRLLFVGRLGDTRKGVRYAIQAYARLQARGVPATLDIVGELGAAEPPPRLPGLTYHGDVALDRLIEHYRACDALVAPSTGQESFGIILLEAMASAKPVICSDIEGYRQVATTSGSRLVTPSSVDALEKALVDFVKLDLATRRRMGEANRMHARRYDWEVIAQRVRREYLAAMGFAVDPFEVIEPEEVLAPVSATGTR